MEAQCFLPYYPGTSNNFIWYETAAKSFSHTHLTTTVTGYIQVPYIYQYTYHFVLILAGNPLLGSYIIIQKLQFGPSVNQIVTSYPSKYTIGDSLSVVHFISEIVKVYPFIELMNYNFEYFIRLNYNADDAVSMITTKISLPTYITDEAKFKVSYLQIVISQTQFTKDYPLYKFTISTFSTLASNLFSDTLPYDASIKDTNPIYGISQYQFYNYGQPSFKFTFSYSSFQLDIKFKGNTASTDYLVAYSYAIFPVYTCSKNYPIYDSVNEVCCDICPITNYYFSTADQACIPCEIWCLTCVSKTQCTSCDPLTFRTLKGYSCIPDSGYYENQTAIAALCDASCVECQGSATNCSLCVSYTQALLNGQCILCSGRFSDCEQCTDNYCLVCKLGYVWRNGLCVAECGDSCLICHLINTTICLQCIPSMILNNGVCQLYNPPVTSCGNYLIQSSEQCDDGNHLSHDGCSPYCMVESNYKCYSNMVGTENITLYCAYIAAIDFSVVSHFKLEFSNKIRVIFKVTQSAEAFWKKNVVPNHFCTVNAPPKCGGVTLGTYSEGTKDVYSVKLGPSVTSPYATQSLFTATFEYFESIEGKAVTLRFDFSAVGDPSLAEVIPSSQTLTVRPENNLLAELYPLSVYDRTESLSNAFFGLSLIVVVLLIASYFFGGKPIFAETAMLLQLTWAELLSVPRLTPLYVAIAYLYPSFNPINPLFFSTTSLLEDSTADPRLKGAKFFTQFAANFNFGALFVLLPPIVGLALKLLSRMSSFGQERRAKLQRGAELALGEYTFAGLTYASVAVGTSSALQLRVGFADTASTLGLASIALMAVMMSLYFIFGVIVVKRRLWLGEFSALMVSGSSAVWFQLGYFYSGLIAGFALGFLGEWQYVHAILGSLAVALFVWTLSSKLFLKNAHKYRVQLNLITFILIQLPYAYASFFQMPLHKQYSDSIIQGPTLIFILILILFLSNVTFAFYLSLKWIRLQYFTKNQDQFQLIEHKVVEDQMQNLKKLQMANFKSNFNRPIFRNGFIKFQGLSSTDLNSPQRMKLDVRIQKIDFINNLNSSIISSDMNAFEQEVNS